MTKQTLGNRSFIDEVEDPPKYQSVAIVGTNDRLIGFDLGTRNSGGELLETTRSCLIALCWVSPWIQQWHRESLPIGYAAVGGFDPWTPKHRAKSSR